MQLRHKKCSSAIHNHKWPVADGIAAEAHMDSVVPVKKAKLRQKSAVSTVQITLHQCQEVFINPIVTAGVNVVIIIVIVLLDVILFIIPYHLAVCLSVCLSQKVLVASW